MNDNIFDEYIVRRINDVEGRHHDCTFFVLDLVHDPNAIEAIRAYAEKAYIDPEISSKLIEMAQSYYHSPEEAS